MSFNFHVAPVGFEPMTAHREPNALTTKLRRKDCLMISHVKNENSLGSYVTKYLLKKFGF